MTASQYYCNQKFWWLTVDLEKLHISSCCSATPLRADIDWIRSNPGQLFNNPNFQNERRLMLDNQPAVSCENNCWKPESKNLPSRRTIMLGTAPTHDSIQAEPEVLNIITGSDCNLTCVYCCKFYSTAWTRDILSKTYPVQSNDDRFTINNTDKVLSKLGQKDLAKSKHRALLVDELQRLYKSPVLREVMITGGEPFLYFDLIALLENIPSNITVKVWSGLGVSESRFEKVVSQLPRNTTVMVSAENIGSSYEFVRHGNSWKKFQNNIEILKSANVNYEFMATVSNLTIFGLSEFKKYTQDTNVIYLPCSDPDFLSVSVLDPESKLKLRTCDWLPEFAKQSLDIDPTPQQVYNLKCYLKEFASRRQLDLSVFPESFRAWVQT